MEVVDEIPPEQPEDKEGHGEGHEEDQDKAQDRPSCYWEDEKLIIRASSFGSCFGALVRAANGVTGEPPPEFMLEKFAQGHENEPRILDWIGKQPEWLRFDDWELEDTFGGPLHDGQVRLELPVGDRIVIRQHFDAFAKDASGAVYPVEAKALAESSYKAYKRLGLGFIPNYPWQVSIAGWASSKHFGQDEYTPVLVVVGVKDKDGICQDYYTEVVDTPPYSLVDIQFRAMSILAKVEAGGIPECDWAQFPCPYWQDKAHKQGVWAKNVPITAAEAKVDGEELIRIASDYAAGRDMEKRGKEIKNEAKVLLDELLEGRLDKPVAHGGYVVKPMSTKPKQGKVDWEKAARDKGVTDQEAEGYRGPEYMGNWYKVEETDDATG